MTVPYNAKPFSNRGYIRDALKEKGVEIDKDDLTKTVEAVRNAMDEVVPGPMAVMSWIESEVAKAIDRGERADMDNSIRICRHSKAHEKENRTSRVAVDGSLSDNRRRR